LSTKHPHFWGTICAAIAAVGYTSANIFLRSVSDCHPMWVTCIKATTTASIVLPFLLFRVARSQRVLPSAEGWVVILSAGLIGQFGGNVLFQWSLGQIGMAFTIPLVLGALISGAAGMGWLLLGERVPRQTILAMTILVAAIAVLSLGAQEARASVAGEVESIWVLVLGVGAALLAGLSYAVLNVALRRTLSGPTPQPTAMFLVALVGAIVLGGICLQVLPREQTLGISGRELSFVLAAGLCNSIAFAGLTKALQLATVAHVNAVNASQTAMAAVAGVVLFPDEHVTLALLAGVMLTIIGLLLVKPARKPKPEPEPDPTTAAPASPPPIPRPEPAVEVE